MDVKPHSLFHLGGHSKQAGDERDLSPDVPFSTPCPCPFRMMVILSYPCKVFQAVSMEKKPNPGLTHRLMKR